MLSFSKSFIYCLENLLMPYCYAICKLQDFLLDLFGTAVELDPESVCTVCTNSLFTWTDSE